MLQSTKALLSLREMILEGELSVHDPLSEPMLADRLAVSRTPIRLALVKLEHEGLVKALPSGGYQIRTFSKKDVFDAIELRGTLEGLAARFAAEARPTRSALDSSLRRAVIDLDAVLEKDVLDEHDFVAYMEGNERFHNALLNLADSPVIAESLMRIERLPFASPSAFVMAQAAIPESRQILTVAQHQHKCLLEAVEFGEGARAEAMAREHARCAKYNLDIVLNHDRAGRHLPGLQLVKNA